MSLPSELLNILRKNGGAITSAQANAIGISNERLRLLVDKGTLELPAKNIQQRNKKYRF